MFIATTAAAIAISIAVIGFAAKNANAPDKAPIA